MITTPSDCRVVHSRRRCFRDGPTPIVVIGEVLGQRDGNKDEIMTADCSSVQVLTVDGHLGGKPPLALSSSGGDQP